MRIRAGCTGKRCFTRFSLAAAAAKRMRRQLDAAQVEAYHCCACGQYHVGDAMRRPDRRRDRKDVLE